MEIFIASLGGFISGVAFIGFVYLVRYLQEKRTVYENTDHDYDGIITYDKKSGREIASCFDLIDHPLENKT